MTEEKWITSRRDFLKATGTLGVVAGHFVQGRGEAPGRQVLGFPFRQIHLDFHTSEHIRGVGAGFDPEKFVSTLKKARVNSVTCFGRCHHGYVYYDTRKFPERHHPGLERNLLKEQIDICHREDIRVPIYSTIQWDHFTATNHPEWLCRNPDGSFVGTPYYEPGFYRFLCLNSPYRDFLKTHLLELFELVPVDGLFLDIVKPQPCSCNWCRAGMKERSLDPGNEGHREQYALQVINEFMEDMTSFIRGLDRNCSIFYNGGHVGPRIHDVVRYYTHLELESLPSGGWGYLHFPLTVRYARKLTDRYLGMTGKFHTSWGDFHSFKNRAALEFECFSMLAHGARCSIGDQLHPGGEIDSATYDLVGSVYREVERREPWCEGARPVTEIAVFSPEEFVGGRVPPASLGVVRILQEGGYQFDVIDSRMDLSSYRLVVLPDVVPVSTELAGKLDSFLGSGGALLASYRSGLTEDGSRFGLSALGVSYEGEAPYSPDFLLPEGELGRGLPRTEHVMYKQGLLVKPAAGTRILAQVVEPYFNRTWEHFCSHRHTPSAGEIGYPGVIQKGRSIYFVHPVFAQYHQNAPLWCKRLVLNAVRMLLPDPVLRHDGPSSLVATVTEQSERKRWVVHLLHYIPERRGEDFDVIEDVIPLHDVQVLLRLPGRVREVALAPQGVSVNFVELPGRIEFTVPRVSGYQMVSVEFS